MLGSARMYAQLEFTEVFAPHQDDEHRKRRDRNWIEVHNPTDSIFYSSIYLTDDTLDLKKWEVVRHNANQHKIGTDRYYVIGVNDRVLRYSALVYVNELDMDSVFLVVKIQNSLKIIDRRKWVNTEIVKITPSSGIFDSTWHINKLAQTPGYKSNLIENVESKKTMQVFVAPVGISGIAIKSDNLQKNSPIWSYGLNASRSRRIFKVCDFQYGISFYRIGYNAKLTLTDFAGTTKRERTSVGKSRGFRSSVELKLGLPIQKKWSLYGGIDLGLVNRSNLKTTSDIKITYEDGSIKNNVLETSSTTWTALSYFFGLVVEAEYQWNPRLSFSGKYIRMNQISIEPSELTTDQWNVLVGANWKFWSGRKHVDKWSFF